MEKAQVQKSPSTHTGKESTQVTRTRASKNISQQQQILNTRPLQATTAFNIPTPAHLIHLQRTLGNQAVGRLIQAKLTISQPDDPYEREADQVANQVMRMPEPETPGEEETQVQTKPLAGQITPLVHRMPEPLADEGDETIQTKAQPEHSTQALSVPSISFGTATGSIQRLCSECAEEEPQDQGKPEMAQRKHARYQLHDDNDEDEQKIQPKGVRTPTPQVTPTVAANIHALNHGGSPLPKATRAFFEPRFGVDLSQVRVHTGSQAAEAAKSINAKAFTVGNNIAFGGGQFAPGSHEGQRLLAHELTHTIQQGPANILPSASTSHYPAVDLFITAKNSTTVSVAQPKIMGPDLIIQQHGTVPRLQRVCYENECDSSSGSEPSALSAITSNEAFVDPGWRNVQELGIAYKEDKESGGPGANLRASPGGQLLEWMPHNTRVFVLKVHDAQKAYAVTRIEGTHTFGYVSQSHIKLNLPDPQARIVKVRPGDTSLGLARQHYRGEFNDAWYADQRYAVNALYWANAHQQHKSTDPPAIEKKDIWIEREFGDFKLKVFVKADSDDAPWETVQVNAGRYLWLPGADFLRSLYKVVREKGGGTGSIKAEVWQTVKGWYNEAAYAIAFVAGIIHGFVKSVWDAIAGIADILYSVLKSLLSGDLISDIKDLAGSIKKMLTEEGRKAVGEAISDWAAEWEEKLKDSSPWVSGHAHGYLTGYVMAEAAMLLLTFGGTAALKGALWGSRLGKLVKGSRAVQTVEKVVAKAASVARATDARFQSAVEALKTNRYSRATVKAAEATTHAVIWTAQGVSTALRLPGRMFSHLKDAVIDRLKQLHDLFPRIKVLSDRAKWWLFECHSPCKVDVKKIRKTLKNLTDEEIEKAVKIIDPKTHGPKKLASGKLAAKAGAVQLDLQDVVAVARARLKAAGVKGLSPSRYGTKLHAEVSSILKETLGEVPKGWAVGSETSLSSLVKLNPATAKMTLRQYMMWTGMDKRYPGLPKKLLDTRIGKLKPDLYVRAPDGRILVWDLTTQEISVHVAKTMVYSELIGRETGGFIRIAEDYWSEDFWKKVRQIYGVEI